MNEFKLTHPERRIVCLAALGGMLEFYDFIIYGIFSVYFAHQFFPNNNPLLSVIQSYVVFILGYIARPIGGIIFSHVGDEHGRKRVLIMTIVLMGAASLGIGILPTYQQIGLAAPLLLLLLRLLQGIAVGGELPSTYVYISESMPTKRGTGFGITMLGVNSGLLLGMLMNQLLNLTLDTTEISAYGWRIPFLFGGLLCLVSYRIRKTLQETKEFTKIHNKPSFPLMYLLKHQFSDTLIGIMLTAVMSSFVMVAVVFMSTYLQEILKKDHAFISQIMLIGMICNVITIYCTGLLANRISPKILLGCLLSPCLVLVPFSYWLMQGDYPAMCIGIIILCMLEGVAAMLIPLLLCDLFPTQTRLTGVALSYNLSFTIFGGLAPIIISSFVQAGFNIYTTPMVYLLMAVIISGVGLKYLLYRAKNFQTQ